MAVGGGCFRDVATLFCGGSDCSYRTSPLLSLNLLRQRQACEPWVDGCGWLEASCGDRSGFDGQSSLLVTLHKT